MTAYELIDQIFSRHQEGISGDLRYVTLGQIDLLRRLIDEGPEAQYLRPARGRSFAWLPSGRHKYVVTEGIETRRNTIARMAGLQAHGAGTLFE